jgi:DNA polymerase-1
MAEGAAGRIIRPAVPVVSTKQQLIDIRDYYLEQDGFAFDVETQGDDRLSPSTNDVAWLSLATNGRADVIPMGHRNGELIAYEADVLKSGRERLEAGKHVRPSDLSKIHRPRFSEPPPQISRTLVFETLAPLFASETLVKVAHNAKFDVASITKYLGFQPVQPFVDTAVAETLIDSRLKHQHLKLQACCKRRLGYSMEKGIGEDITLHSFSETAKYSLLDAKMLWLLWKAQRALLKELGFEPLLRLEMDVQEAIIEMQNTGTRIDRGAMMIFRSEIEDDLSASKNKAFSVAGRTFNFNSGADKISALFDPKPHGQGLKPKKFTEKKGEPSTDKEHLESFPKNELAKAMLEVAEYEKLMSTYLTPYLGGDVTRTSGGKEKVVRRESLLVNGRVHTSFNQTGTETGRFSSSNPNLQNIPSRGRYGKRIRGLFIADPDCDLIVGDYSQIEPRVIASLSEDPVMLDAYLNDRDLYQTIADELSVSRAAGKELVLSMAYGVGPDKMSDRIGITVTQARALLSDFEKQFVAVNRLRSRTIRSARAKRPMPYVTTITGRRRYIPELYSRDPKQRSSGERKAFNTLIQGSAADIMKIALVRAYQMIPDEARLLLTVHDELVIQAPKELAELTKARLTEAMEGVQIPVMKVPLKAEVGIGHSWADAK